MCKYCEMVHDVLNAYMNEVQEIDSFRDGSMLHRLSLNRYADYDEDESEHINELILSHDVVLSDGLHTIQEIHIPIKYCPFCGEKL